jgi:DNA-directed RNA polymerase specialized sigma24 family protein
VSVDEHDWLAARFQAHRRRLRAVAYRMPGSTSEADDAVQEAWIRLSRANAGAIDNLEAWLASAVGGWRSTCSAHAGRGARSHSACTCRTRSWTAPTASTPSTWRWWPPPGSAWLVWPVLVNGAAGLVAPRTDWVRIAALYVELPDQAPSPVVALNRAVAVAMAEAHRATGTATSSIRSGMGGRSRRTWRTWRRRSWRVGWPGCSVPPDRCLAHLVVGPFGTGEEADATA